MLYCKLCKKKVKDISHWAKKHKAYLQKKRAAAPRKKTIKPHAMVKRKAKTGYPHYETSDKGYPYYGHGDNLYCPTCGKRH